MSNYNNYPEGFLEEFNKPVTFKLVNIKEDPENPGHFLMPRFTNIPATSQVVFNNEVVNLAYIERYDANGDPVFGDRSLLLGMHNNGEIYLDPSRAKDRKLFEYINHCHWNRSSKYTNESSQHVVYKFDLDEIANSRVSSRNSLKESLRFIMSASDIEIKSLYVLVGKEIPSGMSMPRMRDELEDMCIKNAEVIFNAVSSIKSKKRQQEDNISTNKQAEEDIDILAMLEEAKKNKIISQYNPARSFKSKSGDFLFQFEKAVDADGYSPIEQFATALSQDDDLLEKVKYLIDKG